MEINYSQKHGVKSFEAVLLKTKTTIAYEDEEGEQLEYLFEVAIPINGSIGAGGRYVPIGQMENNEYPMVIIEKDKSIVHEAIHATIDFFRNETEYSFDELFTTDNPFGEEAFCHYHNDFVKAIKDCFLSLHRKNCLNGSPKEGEE